MGDKTGIAWTETTWNPLRGCSKVSLGCRNCYAETVAGRFSGRGQPYEGTVDDRGRWNGVVKFVPERLGDPIRWTRPRRVFVNSMSDVFHESVPFETIAAIFGVMAGARRHTFQVLTKRPERAAEFFQWLGEPGSSIYQTPWFKCTTEALAVLPEDVPRSRSYITDPTGPWPLPNVWLGVSAEDQATWDARVPLLLQLPAAIRWVSVEPQIGPIDTRVGIEAAFCPSCGCDAVYSSHDLRWHCFVGCGWTGAELPPSPLLGWVVVGGESGRRARPFRIGWARDIVADCHAAGVACFVKQLGSSPVGNDGARYPGINHPKGEDTDEWPPDIRVQEYPR